MKPGSPTPVGGSFTNSHVHIKSSTPILLLLIYIVISSVIKFKNTFLILFNQYTYVHITLNKKKLVPRIVPSLNVLYFILLLLGLC